jgi:hypothetical protein
MAERVGFREIVFRFRLPIFAAGPHFLLMRPISQEFGLRLPSAVCWLLRFFATR